MRLIGAHKWPQKSRGLRLQREKTFSLPTSFGSSPAVVLLYLMKRGRHASKPNGTGVLRSK